jgi:hypothetical protein
MNLPLTLLKYPFKKNSDKVARILKPEPTNDR